MNNNLLQINNLNVSFFTDFGEVKAVRDVSLNMNKSEVIGLVGESGCGKTMTSLSILNLIPKPGKILEQSEILFNDQNLVPLNNHEMQKIRGSKISMIFQEPMTSLNPVLKIGHQIEEMFLYHTSLPRNEIKSRSIELLNKVHIKNPEDVYHYYPHQLSGGMRQRVMIVMAIALQQHLLIADEPTTALDVTVQAQILKLLLDLQREHNLSILFITHDLAVISEIAHRIYIMYAGEIVESGTRDDLFDNPLHPYTQALFEAIPGYKNNFTELKAIPGTLPDASLIPQGCIFQPRCKYAKKECIEHKIELKEKTKNHFSRCIL